MQHDEKLPEKLVNLLTDNKHIIFLFHGVTDYKEESIRNYTGKHLQKELFVSCIQSLSKFGHSLSMDEVLNHITEKNPFPEKSYSITFDDGFENNYSVVAPILNDFNISATIYITTSFVNENKMSWIDQIENAVQETKRFEISTQWGENHYSLKSIADKKHFLNSVRTYVKNDQGCNPNLFAEDLCTQLGVVLSSSDHPFYKKMSWKQLQTLYNTDFITIGGHTHSHPILSFLDESELKFEIGESLRLLNKHANITTKHYSYPEGLEHCYSVQVINELKNYGIECCPTAIFGYNDQFVDPFHLRRILVA